MQHACKQANLALVGLPPWDLLDALAEALREAAFDVDEERILRRVARAGITHTHVTVGH